METHLSFKHFSPCLLVQSLVILRIIGEVFHLQQMPVIPLFLEASGEFLQINYLLLGRGTLGYQLLFMTQLW